MSCRWFVYYVPVLKNSTQVAGSLVRGSARVRGGSTGPAERVSTRRDASRRNAPHLLRPMTGVSWLMAHGSWPMARARANVLLIVMFGRGWRGALWRAERSLTSAPTFINGHEGSCRCRDTCPSQPNLGPSCTA